MSFALKKFLAVFSKVLVAVVVAGTLFCSTLHADEALSGAPEKPVLHIDEALARDALYAGFSQIAVDFSQGILAQADLSDEARIEANLILASAQIEQNEFAAAAKTLAKIPTTSDAKNLRLALVYIGQKDFPAAGLVLSTIDPKRLNPGDAGWYFLARGIVAVTDRNADAARGYFSLAVDSAISAPQRSHFEYVRFWAELILGIPTDEDLAALRERAVAHKGTAEGAQDAKLLIAAYIALAERGNAEENRQKARSALQEFRTVPKRFQAEFDILEALAQNNPASPAARQAYMRAIRLRPDRHLQIFAFEGLFQGVALLLKEENKDGAILAANEIKHFFDNSEGSAGTELLKPDASVLDVELFTRLRIAHISGDEALAIALATELTEKCPQSNYAVNAYNLRLERAIHDKEYRGAVALLEKQRDMVQDPQAREQLNLYIAECYFLNGDYDFAAAAYEKIDSLRLGAEYSGVVFSQLVLSKIKSGKLDEAAEIVDAASAEQISDAWRQRADCALIEALRSAGKLEIAEKRCENFLQEPNVHWKFRLSVLEVEAMLGLELDKPEVTIRNADMMTKIVEGVPEREWPKDFLSRTLLLKIRGLLRGDDAKAALAELSILRERFAETPAAAISYLEEGRALAAKKQPTGALACYEKLIERYGAAPEFEEYTAVAYFEAAQQAITLGRQRDAIRFLDTLVAKFPTNQLCFYARLRQADLFRVLNDFDSALAVYENLIVAFSGHPDMRRVGIARADCLLALALAVGDENAPETRVTRNANLAKAIAAYERLYSLPGVSCELMAEAGYKWGYAVSQAPRLLENPSEPVKADARENAVKIYFSVCNTVFNKATKGGKDPTQTWGISSGYWLSRCLFAMAELYEQGGDYENARKAYTQIINWSGRNWIPGGQYAQARLDAIAGR